MSDNRPVKILFVCLGNICRSPMAEGVFRDRALARGLVEGADFILDSAGTGTWHVGNGPDPRAQATMAERGHDISTLVARQVRADDFHEFDYIFGMDSSNMQNIPGFRRDGGDAELGLFLDLHPDMRGMEVPDPYYGGDDGFARVYEMIVRASDHLLDSLFTTRG